MTSTALRTFLRRWWAPFLVLLLLAQMAAAMVTTAVEQTPTIDEPVYVGTAADYLHAHEVRYNPEHPPLGKLIVAAGVAVADPHVDPRFTGNQGALGRHLLYESGNDPWDVMLWARLPVIALTLLFGLVVFFFARDVAGLAGAFAALALYVFSPDVIAHGSLATLDVPAAGFLLTSAWLLWRADRRPLLYLPLAGLALGAALATKMSTLTAVPVFAGLAVVALWRSGRRGALLGAAGVVVSAFAVVWVSYLLVDPRLRWSPAPGEIPGVRGVRGLLVELLPVPESYRDGMRVQFRFENQHWEGFLFGHLYSGARWYYLPAALLVKTPLGMLALWGAGAVVMLSVRRLRRAAVFVLVPAGVLMASAMTGSRDLGTRYVVFLPMFLAVAASCVPQWVVGRVRVRRGLSRPHGGSRTSDTAPRPYRALSALWVTWALVAFVAVSSLRTFPYYLPYSNEAFGGTSRTHLRLHDSNVDWGQDLGRLAERYGGTPMWLVYKGAGVPAYYGVRGRNPLGVPEGRVRGLLVVSDSAVAKARGRLAELLRTSRVVGEVGHSITVYRR